MSEKIVVLEDLLRLVEQRKVEGAAHYWYVAKDAFVLVQKLKDDYGECVYRPSEVGHPYELLGYPIEIAQDPTWCGIDFLTYPAYPKFDLAPSFTPKHNHYCKDVSNLKRIDVYRVLSLFEVTDPCVQHAIKKLLVAGKRGAGKDVEKDYREAVDSINRALQMIAEDAA